MGRVTDLIDPSGNGQSTIAKLVARFYDIDNEKIFFTNVVSRMEVIIVIVIVI